MIKSDLTRDIPEFTGGVTRMEFYNEIDNGILIPRHYPIQDVQDCTIDGDDIDISTIITPRSKRQAKVMDYIYNNTTGVFKLEPGAGKTVISIKCIATIKKRSIVFVHKKKLRDQWQEAIVEFTSLEDEDIGLLSTKTFKEDLKKPVILSTVQGFNALLNGKKRKEFIMALDTAGIGCAFFDECHTSVGPDKFSLASLSLNCKRVYGLSATPTRADGNDDIIFKHLGPLQEYPAEDDEVLKPVVWMIHFAFEIFSKSPKYMMIGGVFNKSRYYQQMYKSSRYNTMIAGLVNKLYKKDRRILALGNRTNSLLTVAETCKLPPSEIGIFVPTAVKDKKYHEQLNRVSDTNDLDVAFKEKTVVFSTYNAARDGNNRKELDTLIMCLPTGNVEQAAGRVLRTLDGKQQPYVIDLVDTEGPLVKSLTDPYGPRIGTWIKSSQYRRQFYEEKGWEVRDYYF